MMSCYSEHELEQMLEDVVNVLDLSSGVIEEHGPLGTAPADLVRLVMNQKDLTIHCLRAGMVDCTLATMPHNNQTDGTDPLDELHERKTEVEEGKKIEAESIVGSLEVLRHRAMENKDDYEYRIIDKAIGVVKCQFHKIEAQAAELDKLKGEPLDLCSICHFGVKCPSCEDEFIVDAPESPVRQKPEPDRVQQQIEGLSGRIMDLGGRLTVVERAIVDLNK